ncbi:hypothetical protein [Allorhizobium terrae]|nr:hypothetical protein [Allorhizobium terrae]
MDYFFMALWEAIEEIASPFHPDCTVHAKFMALPDRVRLSR